METLLVRLKPHDPRRGHKLRRYTYRGIKFQEERGWYRVEADVADYLRAVRQKAHDPHAPLAFDVCTEAEAKAIDERELEEAKPSRPADRAKETVAREAPPPIPDDAGADTAKGDGKKGRK